MSLYDITKWVRFNIGSFKLRAFFEWWCHDIACTFNKGFLPVSTSEWNGMSCSIGLLLRECIDLQVRQQSKCTFVYVLVSHIGLLCSRLLLHNSPARETMHTEGIEWTNCQHVTGEITVYIRVITTIWSTPQCHIEWLYSLLSHHVQQFWLPTGHLQPFHLPIPQLTCS